MQSRALLLVLVLILAGCAGPLEPVGTPMGTTSVRSTDAGATVSPAGSPATYQPSATPPADGFEATVVDVVDGDTVVLRLPNGSRATARLLGVDTPEVYGETTPAEFEGVPSTAAGRSCLRRWGERASAFAKERLLGERVTVAFDPNEPRRGYYGRLLVYLHDDGTEFNYALVKRGLARVYDSNFVRRQRYYTAEERAMAAGRGLWTCRTPSETTATSTPIPDGESPLQVVAVHADAEGHDGENLNDEYVVLRNAGDVTLDLGGATLVDAVDHTYTFPAGFTLAPGESVTIHTGSGTNTATDLYWGADSPIWNNAGDTVIVRAADGTVLVRHEYE